MEFEKEIKSKLLMRGFTQKTLLNNRGLIGAIIDETILLTTKNFVIPNSCEQLKEKHLDTFEEFLKYHCEKIDDYEYKYKGYQYWKNTLNTIYKQKVKDNL